MNKRTTKRKKPTFTIEHQKKGLKLTIILGDNNERKLLETLFSNPVPSSKTLTLREIISTGFNNNYYDIPNKIQKLVSEEILVETFVERVDEEQNNYKARAYSISEEWILPYAYYLKLRKNPEEALRKSK